MNVKEVIAKRISHVGLLFIGTQNGVTLDLVLSLLAVVIMCVCAQYGQNKKLFVCPQLMNTIFENKILFFTAQKNSNPNLQYCTPSNILHCGINCTLTADLKYAEECQLLQTFRHRFKRQIPETEHFSSTDTVIATWFRSYKYEYTYRQPVLCNSNKNLIPVTLMWIVVPWLLEGMACKNKNMNFRFTMFPHVGYQWSEYKSRYAYPMGKIDIVFKISPEIG